MSQHVEAAASAAAEWIERLSHRSRAVWLSADPAAREAARRRLEALLMIRAGVSHSTAAAHAGVGLPRIYQIAAKWTKGQDLSVLGVGMRAPADVGAARRPRDATGKRAALVHMRKLLGDDPSWKATDVIAAVAECMDNRVSTRTLLRWWKELRLTSAVGPFGARIAFDFCPVAATRPDGRFHVVAVVTDRGTRTLLGAALLPRDVETATLRAAAKSALGAMPHLPLQGFTPAPELRRVSLAFGANPIERLRMLADFDLPARKVNIVDDPRLFGQPAGETLGAAFGPLKLRPGAFDGTSPAFGSEADPQLDHSFMTGLIGEVLEEHRLHLTERLTDAQGRSTEAVDRVGELLTRVTPV